MTKEEHYQDIKAFHPDWTENQIWTQVSIRMKAGDMIATTDPATLEAQKKTIMRIILRQAQRWLCENLPEIWEHVKDFFANLLDNIVDYVCDSLRDSWRNFLNNVFLIS